MINEWMSERTNEQKNEWKGRSFTEMEDRRLYVLNENTMDFSGLFRSVSVSD